MNKNVLYVVLTILVIIGGVFFINRSNAEAEIADAVKVYYDTKGEWAGTTQFARLVGLSSIFLPKVMFAPTLNISILDETKESICDGFSLVSCRRVNGLGKAWVPICQQDSNRWAGCRQ